MKRITGMLMMEGFHVHVSKQSLSSRVHRSQRSRSVFGARLQAFNFIALASNNMQKLTHMVVSLVRVLTVQST